jgi:hypothetical protein
MDRRAFLRAIVAVPLVVYGVTGSFIPLPPPFNIKREISKRLDINAWQVYYSTPIGKYQYEFAAIIDVPHNETIPAKTLDLYDNVAWHSFKHAEKHAYEA